MALTLDATLATAQDSQSRHPLVEIISSQRSADIPFDGSFLTSETFNEFGCNIIPHSTGRLCIAYCYGPDADDDCGIKYVYTDVSRTVYTTITFELFTSTSYVMKGVSICELTGGNIGIIYSYEYSGNHYIRYKIITVTGTAVSDAAIANWSKTTYTTSDAWVMTITTNSYLLVYGKKSGSDYYIYKRTSSNFTTWSSESALSIGGLTSTWRLSNPSILKISTGDLWLWFDALEASGTGEEELTNIYYSVSADAGATWANAVKVTSYTATSEAGRHPIAVQKVANQMHMLFTRKVGALHMDDSTSGWPTGDCTYQLSWDSVNRKLYTINLNSAYGLECVVKIDVDTWAVESYWDETTSPGFPSFITDAASSHNVSTVGVVNDGHIIAVICYDISHRFVWVLDGEANTVTGYYFDTQAGDSITANVSNIPGDGWGGGEAYAYLRHACVDAANDRVWLLFVNTYITHPGICIGYLDLTETSDYEYHSVVESRDSWSEDNLLGVNSGTGGFYVDLDNNYLIVTSGVTASLGGVLIVWDLETGGLIKDWETGDSGFPHFGMRLPFCYGGKIYAGMAKYTSDYSQDAYRGLCEADPISGAITLYRPSYCTDDDHYFGRPSYLQDGRIAMTHEDYGVAVFDTIHKTWELFNNDNVSGMTTDGADTYWSSSQIVYDDTNDLIMVGDPRNYYSGKGVIMFSIHGFLRQASYMVGTNSGSWSFSTVSQLVQGYLDYDVAAAVEPGSTTAMYVFWTNEDVLAEQSIKWDKDGSSIDISSYIAGEVETEHTIDGNYATLSFTVSHGHLFDPYNNSSLLREVFKKGRKLALRWGETVSGTDYWQTSGTFFVTGTSIEFQRGEYPVMKVAAEDQRCFWGNSHIAATSYYSNLPGDIIESILQNNVGLAVGDLNIPYFTGSTNLQIQWIDTTYDNILTQLCERFGYYFRFDVDGKAHAKQITNIGSIDHTYTDNTKLIKFSPDDEYSDFTNQVTVQGQELDFTEVTYDEERITQLSGTLGWWGCRDRHIVWFSDDKSRRCINPRMNVIETATSIPFKLAGSVSESLIECEAADDNKFCTVKISAPNLIPLLMAAVALVAGSSFIPDGVQVGPTGTGATVRVGTATCNIGIVSALMILGSTVNYQIEVWAQPLGEIQRSVQATWNDTDHQTEVGFVVNQTINDPLCYSTADCLEVATFEGTVAKMQRRRVKIQKITHLQDEDGDTIRVVHPYSGGNIDLFVASLRRTFRKATRDGDGYFFDEIEGWVCE